MSLNILLFDSSLNDMRRHDCFVDVTSMELVMLGSPPW